MPSHRAPTVSVVIPVRDDADLLRRCLAAIAAQTVAPAEVVVVDNDSSDDSADVARLAGAVVVHESVLGPGSASAAGYDTARSDVIARLDADCEPATDWIERITQRFGADPALTALTGGADFLDGPRPGRLVVARLYTAAYFAAVGSALGHLPVFGSNCAFRRGAWAAVGHEVHRDADIHDDIDLSFHLGPTARIRYDRQLRMRMSSRPFSRGDFGVRVGRGFRSILIHWPDEWPWLRYVRRAAARRRGRIA